MPTDYVVVSTAVTDDLFLADGTHIGTFLGGAGSYALCGIRLWTDRATLVTGVGEDFSKRHGDWFLKNACSMRGLMVKDPHTAVSRVQYHADGERTETPQYGLVHYKKLEATPEEIGRYTPSAKGAYIFKEADAAYWEQILALKKRDGFRLLWEINADSAVPAQLPRVREIAAQCDLFSINRTEACAMLGATDVAGAIAALQEWDVPMIYLRLGSRGAAVLHAGVCEEIPCMPDAVVEDATGAGNSSSAAVLFGLCEGRPPRECGILGSVSAAHCIAQYGPPTFSREDLARAQREAGQMRDLEELHETK